MDDEKLQKTIEFILNNQAQFYADLQQVQETNKELQEAHKDAEKRIKTLERVSLNLYNEVRETTKNINELAQVQKESASETRELREAQKETDERLNAVIIMFEKFLGNQNGNSK
jgi:methyl-accepting chemotaxis protein